MKAGLRALLLIAGRAPLASFLNKPFLHPSDHRDDEALVAHIKQWTQTDYYAVGTVRWVPTNARSWTPKLNVRSSKVCG
jgi:hypothetical protein